MGAKSTGTKTRAEHRFIARDLLSRTHILLHVRVGALGGGPQHNTLMMSPAVLHVLAGWCAVVVGSFKVPEKEEGCGGGMLTAASAWGRQSHT